MCQYSAQDGVANDWHLVHLGRFALGGAGAVIVEQTAVEAEGRISHGDLGLWSDAQVAPLARIASFLAEQGAVAGIQLGHAGRKGARSRPWLGYRPLQPEDDELAWQLIGPTGEPCGQGWPAPRAASTQDLARIVSAYRAAAGRADRAGFGLLEIHAAHGYLIHSFLSPISNHRRDAYGGTLAGRMRLALEIAAAVRGVWPEEKPLTFRLSVIDGLEGGWSLDDTVALAAGLRDLGVDALDCSSGGVSIAADRNLRPPSHGSQVELARAVRERTGMATIAVGLIRTPEGAEQCIASGGADLVAIGREMLFDPNWPLHAARALGADPHFELWPRQIGLWLDGRERQLAPSAGEGR